MRGLIGELARWFAALAAVALVASALVLRNGLASPLASPSSMPTATPAPRAAAQAGSIGLTVSPAPSPSPTVTPSPEPTPTATPRPTPRPTATPDRAGGPIGGMVTPPPGWSPPPFGPHAVITDGRFGSTLKAGGITITVSYDGPLTDTSDQNCPDPQHRPSPDAVANVYSVTTRWSGFSLVYPDAEMGTPGVNGCWHGDPNALTFTSGTTYTVWIWNLHGQPALNLICFPNNSGDPEYVFRFR